MIGHDALLKSAVLCGIELLERGPEHGNRTPSGIHCCGVSGSVDAFRKPTHDHDTALNEEPGEFLGPAES